ncbi:MAG: hypothetical protein OM95_06925 [Bdellovibrio sp. ArHS]|nr:MAG: hypothetical protein OM95_06925 [Bdellovibrio sp. ArHS]
MFVDVVEVVDVPQFGLLVNRDVLNVQTEGEAEVQDTQSDDPVNDDAPDADDTIAVNVFGGDTNARLVAGPK